MQINTVVHTATPKCSKPRAAWRQRLVLAERGLGNGARQDSIFFVHVFTSTLITLTGGVLGLAVWQWMMVITSLIVLFVAELLNQALKSIALAFGDPPPVPVQKGLCMGTAASMLAFGGVLILSGWVLSQRMAELFTH